MTDPVAEKSGFLKMYMSNHPDTLVAYAKWYGKVAEPITSAEMTAIDTKSMTLTCTLKDGNKKEVRVVLDPPLSGYEDVKPRLLEMKALAQEGLGMIKLPLLTTFQLPRSVLTTLVPIAALIYCTFFPKDSVGALFAPARFVHSYVNGPLLAGIWVFMCSIHALETLYTVSLVRKHAGNFSTGAGYILGTLLFGFPIVMDLRRRIQAARIDSVMKIQ
ncbi:hypothetical protein C8F04DRAFT_1122280 [Mycena alexandri]|uniref:DUF2470 domain-containing protein n=1 Tax=Mycena alexandri TaxID=1745969 RepID=A0AAD6SL30_9AGAR|nr:hypothetical protein C8F04DRAFT_1122280 [Mycena alexandri]